MILAAMLAGTCSIGSAQQAAVADPALLNPENFIGILGCTGCHTTPDELRRRNSNTAWVNLDEYTQWSKRDKHAVAFEMLKSDRAKRMGKVLWNDEDVTSRQECLSCHANWVKGAPKPKQINLEQGVSCESCHGPGKEYRFPHEEKEWRLLSNAEKRAKGMVNVRDPRERASQCLSCHVGNAHEGKVLTHEMYAAGHPPLPGIEIETFAHHMPPHWRYLNEKPADLPDLQKIRELLSQPEGELQGVKSVLVGGVMTLRESAHLVGQQTAKQAESGPEFALFDCAMCHHELQTPSWRQRRMLSGRLTPGRPQLPQWPSALVDAALLHVTRGNPAELSELRKQFADRQGKLQALFNKSPFAIGRDKEVTAAGDDLVRWLDDLVDRTTDSRYDRPSCEAVLIELCRGAQRRESLDYDSARQVGWAIRSIWRQLDPPPGDKAAVVRTLEELTKDLRLDLAWGKDKQILDPQEQEKGFTAVSGYDPQRFQQQMTRLLTALGVPGPAAAEGRPAR